MGKAKDIFTDAELLVLRCLASISPDMRERRMQDPEIFLEMVAIELSSTTGQEWTIKKVLMVLLPILFVTGEGIFDEEE